MKSIERQQGMSSLGILILLLIIGFLATCTIRLLPHYIDSWTLDKAISESISNGEYNGLSIGEIRKKIGKYLSINRLDSVKAKELKISRDKGVTTINADYEKRVPFMFNIDVVLKFDGLIYEFNTK